MKTLIVGGSSGLGLELARDFAETGDSVIITGRKDPHTDFADQMMKARANDYRYKYIRILRQPARVEEVEQR